MTHPTAGWRAADRPGDDFYATEPWLIDAALGALALPPPATVLDPGAGEGVLGAAVAQVAPHAAVTAVESQPDRVTLLRERHPQWTVHDADFLRWAPACRARFDLIVMNPPFREVRSGPNGAVMRGARGQPRYRHVWGDWVQAALPLLSSQGTLVVLGLPDFLGGKARWETLWSQVARPTRILFSPKRASFRNGRMDARYPLWIVWGSGLSSTETHWDWLEVF
jgi:hypothetical protein